MPILLPKHQPLRFRNSLILVRLWLGRPDCHNLRMLRTQLETTSIIIVYSTLEGMAIGLQAVAAPALELLLQPMSGSTWLLERTVSISQGVIHLWLTFCVFSAGGSVRVPTSYQGVFGLRTSRGALSLDRSLIFHRQMSQLPLQCNAASKLSAIVNFDAISPISRNLDTMRSIVRHWVQHRNNTSGCPMRIFYPTHLFPIHDPVGQEAYDNIVSSAEKALGIAREEVDFRVLWRDHSSPLTTDSYEVYFHTVGSISAPFLTSRTADYIIQTFMDLLSWGSYHERAQFRSDHINKFGVPPIVNPVPRYRWEIGKAMTEDDMKTAKKKREIFQRFIEVVFSENTIMFTPFMFEEPGSRDAYRLK
jgi:hypothetical protein